MIVVVIQTGRMCGKRILREQGPPGSAVEDGCFFQFLGHGRSVLRK